MRFQCLVLAVLVGVVVAEQPKPDCDRYDSLASNFKTSRPFSAVPNSRKEYVMNKSPKVISEPMVEEILRHYLDQMNRNMEDVAKACKKSKANGCSQYLYTLAQLASIPPLFLPADVERALLADLPDKATPLLLKILADAYFEEYEGEMTGLALDCIGGGVEKCPRFASDAFKPNGNIEYGRDNVNATLKCKRGYKTRTFNDAVDAVDSGQKITIQCLDSGKWEAQPNCFECEYGWETHGSVPGCYRLFEGVRPYEAVGEYERVCQRHKGHLASFHTDNELGFVANRLMESGDDEAVVGLMMGSYDGSDFKSGPLSNPDGSPASYNAFKRGDKLSKRTACTKLVKDSRLVAMYSVDCDNPATYRFICKRPVSKATGKK